MSKLRLHINAQELAESLNGFKDEIEKDIENSVKSLASMTHAKTLELAEEKLRSLKPQYKKALSFEEVQKGIWVVSLDESAMFIEEGKDPGSMVDDLLKRGFKVAKDGSRYRSIPIGSKFSPSARGESMTPKTKELVGRIKKELSARKISYKKIETNPDGSPRLGLLHKININSEKPSEKATHGVLEGLTIYQRKDAKTGKVKRDILTFRTVSSKHKGSKWNHPGLPAAKLMDEAFDWAMETWDGEILPALMEKYK